MIAKFQSDVRDILINKVKIPADAIERLSKCDWYTPEDFISLGKDQEQVKKNLVDTLEFPDDSPTARRTLLKLATVVAHCENMSRPNIPKRPSRNPWESPPRLTPTR